MKKTRGHRLVFTMFGTNNASPAATPPYEVRVCRSMQKSELGVNDEILASVSGATGDAKQE